jgi:hypothetical protein
MQKRRGFVWVSAVQLLSEDWQTPSSVSLLVPLLQCNEQILLHLLLHLNTSFLNGYSEDWQTPSSVSLLVPLLQCNEQILLHLLLHLNTSFLNGYST